jgi:hypothetical protein
VDASSWRVHRHITMRVPLPLAALAPVEHGAYAREVGQEAGEVDRCAAGQTSTKRHAGTLRTLAGIVDGELAGRAKRWFCLRGEVTRCRFAKPTSV